MRDAPGFDGVKPSPEAAIPLRFAGLVLDLDACMLARDSGEAIPLTRGEFAVLRMFVARPGRVISRDSLLDAFADRRFEPFDRSVDVLVGKLRRKIEPDPKQPRLIVTVSGEGYRFDGLRFRPPEIVRPNADSAAEREPTPIAARESEAARPPAEAASRAAERRHITALAAELVWAEGDSPNDPEDLRVVIDTFRRLAAEALSRYGGAIGESRGREIAAYFGHRQAQENDAERAVRAALAIQRALAETNAHSAGGRAQQLAARIGLDSGLVVVEATGEVFGDAPLIAARVQALADPGTALITARVHRQVAGLFVAEDRGGHALKGAPEPTTLFRIVRASGARRFGVRALTPLVGREEELDLLRRRWQRAAGGEGQFVQIVGEPGIGKSRLVEEFRLKLAETPHTWVAWGASQLLQNTPLHPIAEWGRQRFGGADVAAEKRLAELESALRQVRIDPDEAAPLLAPLLDIPLAPGRAATLAPEETRRRQLAVIVSWVLAGARTQAIVLAFEDLQWADPTSIDLVRALAERGAQAPLLVLATSRPEFRPPWGLRPHHGVVSLGPLDRAQARQMVGGLASRQALSKEVLDGVNERTGGVPLFIEEVTRLLLERGEQGGPQAIPLTLQQSLAARLDRLGEARETAQIGAVLGREFGYPLLEAVAVAAVGSVGGVGDPALQMALDRLAEADILFVEGAGHEANYRFKHALIQDAAYESLLKSRRQTLHRRAAEILVGQPERAAAEPEVIAHHFTEAGLDDLAIEWWGKAGDQALRRSAFQEALAHLGKAIAMADQATEPAARAESSKAEASQRVRLQNDYAQAVLWAKGYAADEAKAAFERTSALAARAELPGERFSALHGRFVWSWFRGKIRAARDIAECLLREAEAEGRIAEAQMAHTGLGVAYMQLGDLGEARTQLELALGRFGEPGGEIREKYGLDAGAGARAYLALALWLSGDLARGRELIEEAMRLASELGHPPTTAAVLIYKLAIEAARNDFASVVIHAENFLKLSQQHSMGYYLAFSRLYLSLGRAQLDNTQRSLDDFRKSLADYRDQGNRIIVPGFLGVLARLEAASQNYERALALIDEALALSQEGGDRLYDSTLHRLRGHILLKRDLANLAQAEDAFKTSLAIAKHQGARTMQLHASFALAKLYQSTGRLVEAHAVLKPALEGFSPTSEMPVIAETETLLAALAETEPVKADAARRQRRQRLQVAYGNALIATRGYGAPETREAFAKAHASALDDKVAPERLAADFGLFAASSIRGDLPAMRAQAAAFLSDVEVSSDSPQACVAHRAAGITHWFAGEYREAREHLERALALFQPGRDDDLAYRFGHDAGVAATLYLALTLWPLGDLEGAASLVRSAKARIASLAYIGTRAYGTVQAILFELMLGNHSRAASDAAEFARITREHDLPFWRAFGIFSEGLASAQSGAAGDGLEDMRRGLELLREQNALMFDGLLKITLAEAEARTSDVDRALAIVDEAVATCDRTGHRSFEAELHRVRGEMLLRRSPANTALAEEAFQIAIAVSKQQGTRAFELRAALALARLHQATGRPVEAHAVLASALEGFSPTPEMREIAEAQTLLAALAGTEQVRKAPGRGTGRPAGP